MDTTIPSADEVRGRLSGFSIVQMQELARISGVPIHTLTKIKSGETENPRIDTVRQFFQHISAAELPAPSTSTQEG